MKSNLKLRSTSVMGSDNVVGGSPSLVSHPVDDIYRDQRD